MVLQKKTLKIEGLHCDSCASAVEITLKELPGVKNVKASFKEKSGVVEFDSSKIKLEKIISGINSLGYKARA